MPDEVRLGASVLLSIGSGAGGGYHALRRRGRQAPQQHSTRRAVGLQRLALRCGISARHKGEGEMSLHRHDFTRVNKVFDTLKKGKSAPSASHSFSHTHFS